MATPRRLSDVRRCSLVACRTAWQLGMPRERMASCSGGSGMGRPRPRHMLKSRACSSQVAIAVTGSARQLRLGRELARHGRLAAVTGSGHKHQCSSTWPACCSLRGVGMTQPINWYQATPTCRLGRRQRKAGTSPAPQHPARDSHLRLVSSSKGRQSHRGPPRPGPPASLSQSKPLHGCCASSPYAGSVAASLAQLRSSASSCCMTASWGGGSSWRVAPNREREVRCGSVSSPEQERPWCRLPARRSRRSCVADRSAGGRVVAVQSSQCSSCDRGSKLRLNKELLVYESDSVWLSGLALVANWAMGGELEGCMAEVISKAYPSGTPRLPLWQSHLVSHLAPPRPCCLYCSQRHAPSN